MNWAGKRVLLTGHTGFKGGWLSIWLQKRGAELCGVGLAPLSKPNMFEEAQVGRGMRSVIEDIRDLFSLKRVFAECCPDIVFHLAAQPLVRKSYHDPVGTYSTNLMGTVNVLEASKSVGSVRAVIVVTTDKCYENREWEWPYRETDQLGGYDPYSSSKACAELAVSAYRNSFFNSPHGCERGVALATVRAGNVFGGGDWSEDRLIPDTIRAFTAGCPVLIRNPEAVRPWQHVLEPLRGYIALAESLYEDGEVNGEAWNFGPDQRDAQSVQSILKELANLWGGGASWVIRGGRHPHETNSLKLDWSKAAARLRWRPKLHLKEALAITVEWYKASLRGEDMRKFTESQIANYEVRTGSESRAEKISEGVEG